MVFPSGINSRLTCTLPFWVSLLTFLGGTTKFLLTGAALRASCSRNGLCISFGASTALPGDVAAEGAWYTFPTGIPSSQVTSGDLREDL